MKKTPLPSSDASSKGREKRHYRRHEGGMDDFRVDIPD